MQWICLYSWTWILPWSGAPALTPGFERRCSGVTQECLLTFNPLTKKAFNLSFFAFLPLTDQAKLFSGVVCLSELLMNCCSFHFLLNYCLQFSYFALLLFCLDLVPPAPYKHCLWKRNRHSRFVCPCVCTTTTMPCAAAITIVWLLMVRSALGVAVTKYQIPNIIALWNPDGMWVLLLMWLGLCLSWLWWSLVPAAKWSLVSAPSACTSLWCPNSLAPSWMQYVVLVLALGFKEAGSDFLHFKKF